LTTMFGKWQHAQYWSAIREMIMKLTKDEVQVCMHYAGRCGVDRTGRI